MAAQCASSLANSSGLSIVRWTFSSPAHDVSRIGCGPAVSATFARRLEAGSDRWAADRSGAAGRCAACAGWRLPGGGKAVSVEGRMVGTQQRGSGATAPRSFGITSMSPMMITTRLIAMRIARVVSFPHLSLPVSRPLEVRDVPAPFLPRHASPRAPIPATVRHRDYHSPCVTVGTYQVVIAHSRQVLKSPCS
jgi:hypothetical protein